MTKSRLEQSQNTKRSILLAAYEIVRQDGVDQLSANKIAEAAGISKGGFFHHFRQVDDLYLYMLDELMVSLRRSAPVEDHDTLASLIDYLAESLIALRKSSPETIAMLLYFFSLCQQNPEYLHRMQSASRQMFSAWVNQLAILMESGTTSETMDEIIRLIDSFFLGFAIHSLLFDDVDRYRKLARSFGEMLERTYVGAV